MCPCVYATCISIVVLHHCVYQPQSISLVCTNQHLTEWRTRCIGLHRKNIKLKWGSSRRRRRTKNKTKTCTTALLRSDALPPPFVSIAKHTTHTYTNRLSVKIHVNENTWRRNDSIIIINHDMNILCSCIPFTECALCGQSHSAQGSRRFRCEFVLRHSLLLLLLFATNSVRKLISIRILDWCDCYRMPWICVEHIRDETIQYFRSK